jgi:uncharacterized membrane protein YccC
MTQPAAGRSIALEFYRKPSAEDEIICFLQRGRAVITLRRTVDPSFSIASLTLRKPACILARRLRSGKTHCAYKSYSSCQSCLGALKRTISVNSVVTGQRHSRCGYPMNVTTSNAPADSQPIRLFGLPIDSWAFAVRTWLGILLALYVSFWLELDAPYSAAITVAILALPTRGQGLEKAGFRVLGTAIGVVAAIVIAGLFSQTSSLILAVFSIWVGLCVYAARTLDGNRAYAAALCCVTVGLVAVQQIDSPLQVFSTGTARGAAIAVGVLASGFVNDLLATPDYHPVLLNRLEALHHQVIDSAEGVVRNWTQSTMLSGGLMRDIVALRPETASLATESSSGKARSAAARTAMVDLVAELFLARALTVLPAIAIPTMQEQSPSELQGQAAAALSASSSGDQDDSLSVLLAISRDWLRTKLVRRSARVQESIEAMRDATPPYREWRAPLYRSHRLAAETGVRAAVHFALASAFFVVTGWPATELCLTLVAVVIGIASVAPNPRMFIVLSVLATPLACLLAGILKYIVLDGVSEFQLLAIGLAPFIIGLALMITLPSRIYSPLGRLTLVFTLAVLAPTNPQTYDPLTFLTTSLFVCLAAILVFTAQLLFPPLSDESRLRQMLKEARRELDKLNEQEHPPFAPEDAMFLDATRIEQIVAIGSSTASGNPSLDRVMRYIDEAGTIRLCRAELDTLADEGLTDAARAARTSLVRRDARAMLAAAKALRETASSNDERVMSACAALVLASIMVDRGKSGAVFVQGDAS